MLRPFVLLLVSSTLLADDNGVRRPERLTTGVADQLLGQLSPDGKKLYYLSNRNTTNELYEQELSSGRATLLFDEGADVTWPRISPDGKRILYVSFHDDAAGELCVRELPDKRRRCLSTGGSALQAQWMDKNRILLLSRGALEADLRVWEVKVGWRLSAKPLFDRNLSSPTLSPDGRWLVYVPVQRYLPSVGPGIAARAADRLEALRLDKPGAPVPLDADLPGLTGQPSFSPDGRWLYFTQFFNDTNQDGEIDGGDNGVLFRQPFEPGRDDAPARAAAADPQQLTDSSWNCQYPSPSSKLLAATCSRKHDLEVYSLPLDGQVPDEWKPERLMLELDLASREAEKLILYRRLLEEAKSPTGRRAIMMRLLHLHLSAGEFAAAQFYAEKVKAMPDPATAGAATALLVLIEHRKALHERERGRMSVEFRELARQRMDKLQVDKLKMAPAILLRRVVRSEIEDSLGDKDAARSELEAAPVDEVALPVFLASWYERADALYRQLDDREALVAACERLAQHPGLKPDERLKYARAATRALTRGRPWDEAQAALDAEKARFAADSELAFAFELSRLVLTVREENISWPLRKAFIDLYHKQTRLDRKRAVVLDAVQRGADLEAEKLVEAVARVYVEDAPKGTGERLRAENLFERAMLGRAYRRLERGDLARAREAFEDLAKTTNSYEAHLGYVDLSLKLGKKPAEIEADFKDRGDALHFVRVCLILRALPSLSKEQQDKEMARARDELHAGGTAMRAGPAPQLVWGALHHERFLETGDKGDAQRANVHYLVALELVQGNPRLKALALEQLAQIQAQVGNYRIALGYAQDREKLPIGDPVAGLAQHLLLARLLFHVDRVDDAIKVAEAALAEVDRTPALAGFRVLALDRAALYALAGEKFERSAALYDRELPLIDAASNVHDKLTIRLGHAAAAVGAKQAKRAIASLDFLDRGLADPTQQATLVWGHTPRPAVLRGYRLIAAGLRANAHLEAGELDAAARALETRRLLAVDRLQQSGLEEHIRALMLVEARLAELARERGQVDEATRWVHAALDHADEYVKKTGVSQNAERLDLLRLAAELTVSSGRDLKLQIPTRLHEAFDELMKERDPAFRTHERWLELYLPLLPR